MSATVLYMSMSLDGFIAGPNETDDNGLGDVTACTTGPSRMSTLTRGAPTSAVWLAPTARSRRR
jgi:hypothetical protein